MRILFPLPLPRSVGSRASWVSNIHPRCGLCRLSLLQKEPRFFCQLAIWSQGKLCHIIRNTQPLRCCLIREAKIQMHGVVLLMRFHARHMPATLLPRSIFQHHKGAMVVFDIERLAHRKYTWLKTMHAHFCLCICIAGCAIILTARMISGRARGDC